jgi:hypothetical protein
LQAPSPDLKSKEIKSKEARMILTINSPKHGTYEILIDKDDYEKVIKFKWHLFKSGENKFYVHACTYINRKVGGISLHRLICGFPENKSVDHIDGNTLNNCKSNLRICDHKENIRNSKKNISGKTSKYKGVRKHRNSYTAQIMYNYKSIYIGSFKTEELAGVAYNKKAVELFGEFARLNEVDNV